MTNIDVLSVGKGHLELSFDPSKEEEKAKAKEMITDLLEKGYKLIVHEGGEDKLVTKFDPDKYSYTVVETGPGQAKEISAEDAEATAFRPTAGG